MARLRENIIWNSIRVGSNIIFPLITFPYASRILGPASIGLFNYAFAIASYFTLIASFGFNIWGTREVAIVRNNNDGLNQVTNQIFTASILTTLISIFLYVILCYFIIKDNYCLFLIVGVSILMTSISFEWFYQGIEDFKYVTIRGIIVKTICLISLFLWVKTPDDLLQYSIITISATCGNNIINIFYLKKYIKVALNFKNLKYHISGSAVLFLGSVAVSFYSYINDILIGIFAGMESVGYFSTGNKIVYIIISVINVITLSVTPRITNLIGNGNEKESAKLQYDSILLISHITIPIFVLLFVLAEPIILLFAGDKFLGSVPIIKILSLIVVIIPLSSFFSNLVLIPNRKEKYTNISLVSGAVVNILSALILLPVYSYIGEAIALLCAEFVVCLINFLYSRNYVDNKNILKSLLPPKVILASVFMGILLFFILNLNIPPSLVFVLILVGIGIYLTFLRFLKDEFFLKLLNFKSNLH